MISCYLRYLRAFCNLLYITPLPKSEPATFVVTNYHPSVRLCGHGGISTTGLYSTYEPGSRPPPPEFAIIPLLQSWRAHLRYVLYVRPVALAA